MKNNKIKRKTVWMILSAITILVLAASVLVGCSYFNKDEPIEDQLPEDILSEIKGMETQLQGSLQDVLDVAMSGDAEPNELLSETEYRNGFKVLSHSETETGVLVTFLVHAPDLYTVVKEIDENNVFENDDELRIALIDAVKKAPIVEQEVTIEFALVDGEYIPMLNYEFFDAYFGGIFKLLNESLGDMEEMAE